MTPLYLFLLNMIEDSPLCLDIFLLSYCNFSGNKYQTMFSKQELAVILQETFLF